MVTDTEESTDESTDVGAEAGDVSVDNAPEEEFVVPEDANEQAMALIKKNVLVSLGIGLVPVPAFDLVALTGQQLYMVKQLGDIYGVTFKKDLGRKVVVALIGAAAPTSSLQYVAASLFKSVPLVGTTVAGLTMPLLSGALTYAVGKILNLHFASGGTYLSFDPERYKARFQRELRDGMKLAGELK